MIRVSVTDATRADEIYRCPRYQEKLRGSAGSDGRTHSQPAMPPSAAQSAVTSITVRSARSNAAVATWNID
jgi:hypothetical protein